MGEGRVYFSAEGEEADSREGMMGDTGGKRSD